MRNFAPEMNILSIKSILTKQIIRLYTVTSGSILTVLRVQMRSIIPIPWGNFCIINLRSKVFYLVREKIKYETRVILHRFHFTQVSYLCISCDLQIYLSDALSILLF